MIATQKQWKTSLPDNLFVSLFVGDESVPDMPALRYREAYEPAIMYNHLSLWDALSFTEGVSAKLLCICWKIYIN